jgi:hypothetical protein
MISNEKIELESCRSQQMLQFSYKLYLYPRLYEKVIIFKKPSDLCCRLRFGVLQYPQWGTVVCDYNRCFKRMVAPYHHLKRRHQYNFAKILVYIFEKS